MSKVGEHYREREEKGLEDDLHPNEEDYKKIAFALTDMLKDEPKEEIMNKNIMIESMDINEVNELISNYRAGLDMDYIGTLEIQLIKAEKLISDIREISNSQDDSKSKVLVSLVNEYFSNKDK